MAERQKLIAVCLSEAHNFLNTGFLTELGSAAAKCGYGVAVFNSSLDFYWYQRDNNAPRAGYRAIRYELFDAVFIICHSFHDDALVQEIVNGAQAHNVPVILSGKSLPGCYTVTNEYEDCFKSMIRHIIREHGVKKPFFIAGMKNEPNSEDRFRCYREVLDECGLRFNPLDFAYGNYWAKPAAEIVLKRIRSGQDLPDAIVCANDTMAISVCDTLRENGYRVPEDVIVTGFDGAPAAYMIHPRLTTCSDNPRMLAEQTMDLVLKIKSGENPPMEIKHSFQPVYSESCGCPCTENDRFDALTVYRRSEALNDHENDLYHQVERLLLQKEPNEFLKMVSVFLLPGSFICLNKSLLSIYSGADYNLDRIEDDLLFIPHQEKGEDLILRDLRIEDMFPPKGQETGLTVFNTIHTGSVVCGIFATHTNNMEADAQFIRRLQEVLNLVFAIQLGNARQEVLIHHLDNTLYMDSVSGLNNLKGLNRWFEKYVSDAGNHQRPLALSVYSIHHYNYIYENYGMNDTEEIVRLVSNRLTSANPNALIIARISEDQFAVIDSGESLPIVGRTINRNTEDFYRQIESYNSISSKPYFIEVNSGCTTMDSGWQEAALENLIRLALGELYLNRLNNTSRAVSKTSASATELYSAFNLLMEKNLFKFHFQPIVDAKSAQIYAYEALMRTDNLINLSPIEILDIAREYNRLYDVERATFFGIIETFVKNYSDFYGNKVFINTIPGHFLTEEDCALLKEEYEGYLGCFVYELTEQDTTTDEELFRLKSLCKTGGSAQIAIDDYGTGHSNIVNVLRYAPQIIKIDRELISGIQNDKNKQLFVRNTIDFAHQNGIKALAEGVETSDELKTVIECGIDLIQGFYTGRPSEHPVRAVNEIVHHEIIAQNLIANRFDRDTKVYTARDGETIDLLNLAMDHFTCIQVPAGEVTVVGQKTQSVDMLILVEENARSVLVLKNVNIKGVNEPVIQLGNHSSLTLRVEGINTLNKDGIQVPSSAALTLQGNGDLAITNSRNYSVGIGSNYNDPHGTIVLDMEGKLTIQSSGDKVACIGGGRSAGEGISLLRGTLRLNASGISVVGVGSTTGDTRIEIRDADLKAVLGGNDALGVGSLSGHAEIHSTGLVDVTVNCERATGIGSLTATADILLDGGVTSVVTHCDVGACIGTFSGEASTRIRNARVKVHGEGTHVAGLGSSEGACDTNIESGFVQGDILAAERLLLGNEHSRVIITGGNVRLFPEDGQFPVSPGGLKLHLSTPDDVSHFEKTYRDRRESWTYRADRDQDGSLYVWLPPLEEEH